MAKVEDSRKRTLRCGCAFERHPARHNQWLALGGDGQVCKMGWPLPPAAINLCCANWEDHVWVQQPSGYYRCSKCPWEKTAGEIAYMDSLPKEE